jgi:hypothetical protein
MHGLTLVHSALRRSLETIRRVAEQPIPDGDRAAFAEFTGRFLAFLRSHHDGEEEIAFPAFERGFAAAQLPEAAAEIGRWRAAHEKLLAALDALESATATFARTGARAELAKASAEVAAILLPHLDAEEGALDEATLAKVFSGAQAMDLARGLSKHGQKHGGPRVLMYFLHGLTDDEQRAHFGAMPWFVRRVLVKRIWERGYQPLLKYAHNRSIAL